MSSAHQTDPGTSSSGGAGNRPAGASWTPSRQVVSDTHQLQVGGKWRRRVAVSLKLLSSLCGLAAVILLVRPLAQGELTPGPRYITLEPGTPSVTRDAPAPVEPSGKAPPTPSRAGVAEPPPETPEEAAPATAGVQEQRSAFQGALLMLESQPAGATVRVNNVNQGETPVTVGLDCVPGRTLVITYSLRGFEGTTHRTSCPRDALVTVKAQLRRSTGKPSGKASSGKR